MLYTVANYIAVASYSKQDSEAQDEENIYENCAVGSGYCRETNEDKCKAIYNMHVCLF